jgi:hypothetical protein
LCLGIKTARQKAGWTINLTFAQGEHGQSNGSKSGVSGLKFDTFYQNFQFPNRFSLSLVMLWINHITSCFASTRSDVVKMMMVQEGGNISFDKSLETFVGCVNLLKKLYYIIMS